MVVKDICKKAMNNLVSNIKADPKKFAADYVILNLGYIGMSLYAIHCIRVIEELEQNLDTLAYNIDMEHAYMEGVVSGLKKQDKEQ